VPRYLIQRSLGDVSDEQLTRERAAVHEIERDLVA
jgi:hypothetical protein